MRRSILAFLFVIVGLASLQQGLDSLNPSRQAFLSTVGLVFLVIGCGPVLLQIYRFQKKRRSAKLE